MVTKTDAIINSFSSDSDPSFSDVADLLNAVTLKPMSDNDRIGYAGVSDNARMGYLSGKDGLIVIGDRNGLEVGHYPAPGGGSETVRIFTLTHSKIVGG